MNHTQLPKRAAAKIAMEAMNRNDALFERIVACAFDEKTARYYRDCRQVGTPPATRSGMPNDR